MTSKKNRKVVRFGKKGYMISRTNEKFVPSPTVPKISDNSIKVFIRILQVTW